MKIIFAQGNPGSRYEKTRHNVGFLVLDALQKSLGGSDWKKTSKGTAIASEATVNGEKVLLVKPFTFYNETGPTVRALVDFYKLNPSQDLLVVHDDLALPFGTIRVREKGSDAGNNGIRSLNSHLGSDYARIRVGIWNDLRDRTDDATFVLSSFTAHEREALDETVLPSVLTLIDDFVRGELKATSHSL